MTQDLLFPESPQDVEVRYLLDGDGAYVFVQGQARVQAFAGHVLNGGDGTSGVFVAYDDRTGERQLFQVLNISNSVQMFTVKEELAEEPLRDLLM